MKSPAADIAQFLATNSVGTHPPSTGWGIVYGKEPSTPDDVITVYDYPNGVGVDTDEQNVYDVSFQIRTRSNDYDAAYAKQEAIRDLLITSNELTLSTSKAAVSMSSGIFSLGQDQNERFILVSSYRAIRT